MSLSNQSPLAPCRTQQSEKVTYVNPTSGIPNSGSTGTGLNRRDSLPLPRPPKL